jgi:hypothetical protein
MIYYLLMVFIINRAGWTGYTESRQNPRVSRTDGVTGNSSEEAAGEFEAMSCV